MTLSRRNHTRSMNLQAFLFCLTLLLTSPYSAPSSSNSYSNRCSSLVPQRRYKRHSDISPDQCFQKFFGYYLTIITPGSRTNRTENVSENLDFTFESMCETDARGLLNVHASLTLYTEAKGDSTLAYPSKAKVFAEFTLNGLWSESHGKLCLVGNGVKIIASPSEYLNISVTAKLYNLYNSTILTSLIIGNLESLVGPDRIDSNHFDPVSFMLIPAMNYEYKLVQKTPGGKGKAVEPPLLSPIASLISLFRDYPLTIKDSSHTNASSRNVNLEVIEYDESANSMRILIRFEETILGYPTTLDPKSTLLGEAVWDSRNDQLYIVACRFLNATDTWDGARVGDCSTRMSLRFSETWTLVNTSTLTGRIWSTKTASESGFLKEAEIELFDHFYDRIVPTKKYEYTRLETAKRWRTETSKSKKRLNYPDPLSEVMKFEIRSIKGNAEIDIARAEPISVGDELYFPRRVRKSLFGKDPTNMSYLITMFETSPESKGPLIIHAEGTYDTSTGRLCMIGCRKFGLRSTVDCEILVNFQFPEKATEPEPGFPSIYGIIESKRKKTDPLYFRELTLEAGYYHAADQLDTIGSIRLADFRTNSGIVSKSLACVFVAHQISHLRRNRNLSPLVSVAMLLSLIWTFSGEITNHVTYFDRREPLLGTPFWKEEKEVAEIVVLSNLVCLHAWILRLVLAARWANKNRRSLWIAEFKSLVTSQLIFAGATNLGFFFSTTHYVEIFSGFLLPQILMNAFANSREEPLSRPLYVGMSFVRLLPCTALGLYMAANLEYGSGILDVEKMNPYGGLIFAGIVYLQHKFGGRCIGLGSKSSLYFIVLFFLGTLFLPSSLIDLNTDPQS